MKKIIDRRIVFLFSVVLFFAACKKEPSCKNCENKNPPVAKAGNDTALILPVNTIDLDGSKSSDPDNNIGSYLWTKVAGPASFIIESANTAQTKVSNLIEGRYQFELKVTDKEGLSAKDTIIVTVSSLTNLTPIANAGNDTTIMLPSHAAILDGSKSSDPDNNIGSYLWTKISGPSSFTITNANAAQSQVTNLEEGTYQFELKVTDANGLYAKDTAQITVLNSNTGNNVCIAGWGTNSNGKKVARVWSEGVLYDLSDGQYNAEARSIFVSGTNIYVAGWEKSSSGKNVAKLWKNGVVQNLSNGLYDADARSVFVSDADVYVAGWEVNASGKNVAKLWKNGVAQNLSNGQNNVMAYAVYVANSDVYVTGFDVGSWLYYGQPILWKNGVAQNLGGTEYAAYSVFVSGSDVYVAGSWYGEFAKLWKNGMEQGFSGGDQFSEALSVFVSGNDVFVAGTRYPCAVGGCSDAMLWKNGQPHILQSGLVGAANSVFVSGNNVYVAGDDGTNAVLWKNGLAQTILGLNTANAVFVK